MIPAVAVLQTGRPVASGPTLLGTATAWWTAKHRSGDELDDQGPGGHNAVPVSGPVFGDDGTHHYVDCEGPDPGPYFGVTHHADFDAGTDPWTWVAVGTFVPGSTPALGQIVLLSAYDGVGVLFFGTTMTNQFIANLNTNPTGDFQALQSSHVWDATPVVLAVTRSVDGTTIASYVDGTLTDSYGAIDPADDYDSSDPLFLGGYPSGIDNAFRLYGAAYFNGIELTGPETATVATELLAADLV